MRTNLFLRYQTPGGGGDFEEDTDSQRVDSRRGRKMLASNLDVPSSLKNPGFKPTTVNLMNKRALLH